MKYTPAIIVIAYNRPKALLRLLGSIGDAVYPKEEVTLLISIDKSESGEVAVVANEFEWHHGNKEIVEHQENLGLKRHILKCGDYTKRFGSIIMLEDDLFVSNQFYRYTQAALEYFESDKNIAGISLYNINKTDDTLAPFSPIDDGFDNYFVQLPSSWGQAWARRHWENFTNWRRNNLEKPESKLLSFFAQHWSEHSWKKIFLSYMLEENLFFVYPRVGLSTNFHSSGTNNQKNSSIFQCALLWGEKRFEFNAFEASMLKYDQYVEWMSLRLLKEENPVLNQFDFELDLRGGKTSLEIKKEYVITCQKHKKSILSFSNAMQPLEWNLLKNISGKGLSLCKKEDLRISLPIRIYNYLRPHYFTGARLKNKFHIMMREYFLNE